MLDKSIEYKNIIMRIESDKILNIANPALPCNFSFRHFRDCVDIKHWSRIETSVLEFSAENDAENYFTSSYWPYLDDLTKRCLFIINQDGLPIATATAWFANSELGYQASLHWVAVCPEYQGMGLGKAIVQKALILFKELEPNNSVWLHTQTWSHTAVKLYHTIGFNIFKNDKLANANSRSGIAKIHDNDFEAAMEILKKVVKQDDFIKIIDSAV